MFTAKVAEDIFNKYKNLNHGFTKVSGTAITSEGAEKQVSTVYASIMPHC